MDWLEMLPGDVRARGLDLSPWHVHGTAFELADGLAAAAAVTERGIVILGGDVWRVQDGTPRPAHENWHIDREVGEDWDAYVGRSLDRTRQYLTWWHGREEGHRFVLVCIDEAAFGQLKVNQPAEAVQVDGPGTTRWGVAVERFALGGLIEVAGLVLGLEWDGPNPPGPAAPLVIRLDAPAWWKADMDTAHQRQFQARVDQAWADVDQLLAESPDLRTVVSARDRRIEVVRRFGMGITIAAQVVQDGTVTWVV